MKTTAQPAAPQAAPTASQKPQIVLTFLAQQYGLTIEDVMQRNQCDREQVIVEQAPNP